jgi:histone-lysine N-methyltransferase SETMAR
VGRFINHACDGGNLSLQLVRVGGCPLPRVAFFAALPIAEGAELAFSYAGLDPGAEQQHAADEAGEAEAGMDRRRPCACQTSACTGLLPRAA